MKEKVVLAYSGGLDTVSYTHLDVYKRQVQGWPSWPALYRSFIQFCNSFAPVPAASHVLSRTIISGWIAKDALTPLFSSKS